MKTTIHLCAWAFALGLGAAGPLAAQGPAVAAHRVLLLDNEQVLEGEVMRQGDQYILRAAGGELKVPASKVFTVCNDLQEAFKVMSNRANLHDGGERLRLARWCQTHGLPEQAFLEAKAALAIRPGNPEISQLLAMLERTAPSGAAPPAINQAKVPIDAPPLEVNSECLALFSTKVQTILMNTCASCHATGHGGAFVLTRPTTVSSRLAMQLNLNAAIRQISFDQPLASPILYKACTAHGGEMKAALPNQQSPAFTTLEAWVQQVALHHPHLRSLGAAPVAGFGDRLALSGGQWAVDSGQRTADSGHQPVGKPLSPKSEAQNQLPLASVTKSNNEQQTTAESAPLPRPVEILPNTPPVEGKDAAATPTARAVAMWANNMQVPGAALASSIGPRPVEFRPSTTPAPPTGVPGTPRLLPVPQTPPQDLSGPYDPRPFNEMNFPTR